MAKSGHSFPSSAGFTNSTGKTQSVKGYTRSKPVHKAIGGSMPLAAPTSGPKMLPPARPMIAPPMAAPMRPGFAGRPGPGLGRPPGRGALSFAEGGAVKRMGDGTMTTDTIGDQGNSVVKRGKPFITEADVEYGGSGPLRTGYAKGGKIPGMGKLVKKANKRFGKDMAKFIKRSRDVDFKGAGDQGEALEKVIERNPGAVGGTRVKPVAEDLKKFSRGDEEGSYFGGDSDATVERALKERLKVKKAGGGAVQAAKREVAKHVAAPAPKGHKGFNKLPMFGKK